MVFLRSVGITEVTKSELLHLTDRLVDEMFLIVISQFKIGCFCYLFHLTFHLNCKLHLIQIMRPIKRGTLLL